MSTSCFIASGCPIATTSLYRCIHLREQLRALGHEARVVDWFKEANIRIEDALEHDVIFLYRLSMSPPLRRLIDDARALAKPVIFDTDDLIFEPDLLEQHRAVQNLSPADQIQHAGGVRGYLETLQACETAVVATPLLAELARRRGRPAYVHRNSLGQEMLAHAHHLYAARRAQGSRAEVVLGYGSGTATHDIDFDEAAPALLAVLDRFREVQLWIAGPLRISSEFDRFGARVRRFPLTDWRGWFELASQMDIALAPLEKNNIFCRAKSEIKFVESGALGVPLIASRIDPYRDAVTNGQDGLLAANEAEWTHALTTLIEQPDQRLQIGARARATVLQRYSPSRRTRDLSVLLPQLAPAVFPAVPMTKPEIARSKTKLKINWLIPEPIPRAGGDLGIFRIIRDLAQFGHDCQVYVVPYQLMTDFSPEQIRAHVRQHFGETRAQYHRWGGEIGNADCTFATFWPTVENLTGLIKGGRRFYLVQDFEPSFYPDDAHHARRAENTYRAGLHCITLGPWLAQLLRERYRATADHFDFAVDTQVYRPRAVERKATPRICFYARPTTPRRGYELGLEALRLVKAARPEVEINFYGSADLQPRPSFPFVDRGLLDEEALAALFSSCEVGLVLSLSNPSFVALEMMACRCAVVEIASERLEGVATHALDAWLVEPNPNAIAEGIMHLLRENSLRTRLIENAYERVRGMDWQHAARQIEAVLLRHV